MHKENELLSIRLHLFKRKKIKFVGAPESCPKSFPTMLTRSNLISIPRVIDRNDPTDVQFFLDRFEKYRNTNDERTLPDSIRFMEKQCMRKML